MLRHIFDPYWQDKERPKEGAGLGLATARGSVEAHDRRIWAESTPGEGTTIYFHVAVSGQAPGATSVAGPATETGPHRERV